MKVNKPSLWSVMEEYLQPSHVKNCKYRHVKSNLFKLYALPGKFS